MEQHPRVAIGNWLRISCSTASAAPLRRRDLGPRLRGGDASCCVAPHPRTSSPRRREPSAQSSGRNAINGGMPKQPCVYILASKRNGTIYIGVTSDLFGRVVIHKQDLIEGFTNRYGVHQVAYY
jgi:hypothetical protein